MDVYIAGGGVSSRIKNLSFSCRDMGRGDFEEQVLFFLYLVIWLHWVLVAARGLFSCGMRTLSCGMHVGSSSLTRD